MLAFLHKPSSTQMTNGISNFGREAPHRAPGSDFDRGLFSTRDVHRKSTLRRQKKPPSSVLHFE